MRAGKQALKIRCSLDTAPSHVRNVSVVDYLKKVEAATGGKITGEVFASGQLLRRSERRQGAAAGPGRYGRARRLDADRHRLRLRFLPASGVLRTADRGNRTCLRRQARRVDRQADRDQAAGEGSRTVARSWLPELVHDVEAPEDERRHQGSENPQSRRGRHQLADLVLRRHSEHDGLAGRPAGLVAGHLRRLRFNQRKLCQRQIVGGGGQALLPGSSIRRPIHADDERGVLVEAECRTAEADDRPVGGQYRHLSRQCRCLAGACPQADGGEGRHLHRSVAGGAGRRPARRCRRMSRPWRRPPNCRPTSCGCPRNPSTERPEHGRLTSRHDLGHDRAHAGRHPWRDRHGGRHRAGRRTLFLPRPGDFLGRGSDRLSGRLGR